MDPTKAMHFNLSVVPWRDPEEFIKTYHDLYSDNICEQRRGVDQVTVWRTRCESLPNAIEATVGFVSSVIHHTVYTNTIGPHGELDIQLLYCAAVFRFVYLILEKDKPATRKISLSALAAEHNIPTWFIDLRNDVVHSYMPSLSMLRFGADFALKYLKETYWAEEITNKRQINYNLSGLQRDILNLIREYKELQFQIIIEYLTEERSELLNKNLKGVLKKMSFYIYNCREIFLDILVTPGNFTSFEDLDILLNSKGHSFLEQPNFIIPYKLQKFWFPLLRKLHKKDLLADFLYKLLMAQVTENKVCHKLAIAWGLEIFEGANSKSLLTPLFLEKGVLFHKVTLAYCCSLRPNHYTKELLLRIIDKVPEEKREIFGKFCHLVAMFLGLFVTKEDVEKESGRIVDEMIFTIKDVEDYENELLKVRDRAANIERKWFMASETIDFSQVPLGAILNPIKNDEKSSDDSWELKLGPTADDDFITGENVDPNDVMDEPPSPTVEVEMPLLVDFIYRSKPKE